MPDPKDKRQYPRFQVPGATVSYELYGFPQRPFEEICPVLNLGKGGLGFQTNSQLKPGRKLTVILTSKEAPIQLQSQVIYCVPHSGITDAYHVGVVFAPFVGKGCNSPEALEVLDQLEKEYAAK
jgi:Tfp pilus assembly protein PilZ